MTWLHVSIAVNIVLGIVIILFANFRRECNLRHNPIDQDIREIKKTLEKIWEAIGR